MKPHMKYFRWNTLPLSMLMTASAVLTSGWLDAAKTELIRSLDGHNGAVFGLQFCPDETHLLSTGDDGAVRSWDLSTGKCNQKLRTRITGSFEAIYTPDGTNILTNSKNAPVEMLGLDGKRIATIEGNNSSQSSIAVSPNGIYIATAGTDNVISIWEKMGERPIHILRDVTTTITDIQFHPNSQMMAVSCKDGKVMVYDVQAGYLAKTLDMGAEVSAIKFDPTGDRIACAAAEDVKIVELHTGAILALSGHKGKVLCLDFSPTGRMLVSGGTDKAVRLWSTTTGREMATMTQQDGMITAVAFSPSGHSVAAGSSKYLYDDKKMIGAKDIALYNIDDVYSDNRISAFVEKEMYHWQKKGEFEKTKDHQARLNGKAEQAGVLFAKIYKQFSQEISEEAVLSSYNAEKEEFVVTLPVLGKFVLNVPIEKAPSFKNSFSKAQFRNLVVTPNIVVPNRSTWKLQSLEVYLPTERETYSYADKASPAPNAAGTAKPAREKGL